MAAVWSINFLCGLSLIIFANCDVSASTLTSDDSVLKFIHDLKLKSSIASTDLMIPSKILEYRQQREKINLLSEARKHYMRNDLRYASVIKLDPDSNRDITQLIASQGYPVQKFTVQTKDGFLLDLHRIPYGRKESPYKKSKPAVFLQHGLLSSSADWVMNFANGSLGFILADNGYDVWMGNSRGNTYSKRHVSLKTDDDRFWDWSFDEMAKYDTTAFIDFVLNKTNQPSLHYIGHSQGTIIAFALFSSQPEYQKKIRLFVGLAPIISLNYMESPIKYLGILSDEEGYLLLGRQEFLPNDLLIKLFVDSLCEHPLTDWVCSNIVFLLCGPDVSNLNTSRLTVYMNHSPAGVSVKDMIHYAQFYRNKKFAMYDFRSPSENMKHYNQSTPPAYNASQFRIPALLFTANNDWLADPKDVKILESTLPNIVGKYNIPEWNHLDFVWGIDAPQKCYNQILEYLPKY